MKKRGFSFEVATVPIDKITIDERWDRDPEKNIKIESLAEDIKKHSLLSEIWINEDDDGTLSLIAGYRRLKACEQLGHSEIRAKVYKVDSLQAKYMTAMENLNRINYDSDEKCGVFMFLLHSELKQIAPNKVPDVFVPFTYANAIAPVVSKMHKGHESRAPFDKTEKLFQMTILKLMDETNIYNSLEELYNSVRVELSSPELKKFCRNHRIKMRSLKRLQYCEKHFKEVTFDGKPVMKLIMGDIAKLEKKTDLEIQNIISRYKKLTAPAVELKDILKKLQSNIGDTYKRANAVLKNKEIKKKHARVIERAVIRFEKEIEKIENII